jgi:hypothetical protein
MPFDAGPAAAQQPEAVIEKRVDLGDRHRPAARCREFDGQRVAI